MLSKLLTGGSGLLGTELQKLEQFYAPSRSEFDILGEVYPTKVHDYDVIIHSAAYTDVPGAEIKRKECFDTNVTATLRLLEMFKDKRFVYISSEYAHKPVNFYSLTKSLAEQLVTTHPSYLIIRTLFKPRPWKYEKAFTDQYTMGDYVDVIAPLILQEINKWDGKSKMIYVGTGHKSIFELAQQSRPDVKPISIKDIKDVVIPQTYL